jgi:hypothetical protein
MINKKSLEMETIDYIMEITKLKEDIKSYMQEKIQPKLNVKRTSNIIDRDDLITFHYVVKQEKLVFIYFTFLFIREGQRVNTSVNYHLNSFTNNIDKNKLNKIFITLNKEVKKYVLSRLYNK